MSKNKINYCYINGKVIPESQASLSLFDLGVLRAYAVFDVMYARGNKPFMLREHWNRLVDSAKTLKLELPINDRQYAQIIKKLLGKNQYLEANIRTVLTGGVSADGYNPGKETFYILITPFHGYPKEYYQKGVKMITLEYQRVLPEAKTTHYVVAVKHEQLKKNSGAVEILYTWKGKALEAATSNVFAVKKGRIITPKENILEQGTTRRAVIQLTKKSGIPLVEKDISVRDFIAADEIFLAATNKGIVPVVKVDNKKVGSGKVGKITQAISDLFEQYRNDQLN